MTIQFPYSFFFIQIHRVANGLANFLSTRTYGICWVPEWSKSRNALQ